MLGIRVFFLFGCLRQWPFFRWVTSNYLPLVWVKHIIEIYLVASVYYIL